MSTHPNAMLLCVLTPDDLARKTFRAICDEHATDNDNDESEKEFEIGGFKYNGYVMETRYDESWQISAPEGSIVFHDFLTYGYGERKPWVEVEAQKTSLEEWAKAVCEKHHCSYEISIGANYW